MYASCPSSLSAYGDQHHSHKWKTWTKISVRELEAFLAHLRKFAKKDSAPEFKFKSDVKVGPMHSCICIKNTRAKQGWWMVCYLGFLQMRIFCARAFVRVHALP